MRVRPLSSHRIEHVKEVQRIAENSSVQGILWLVHNGVPFEIAENLTAQELEAWGIVFGTFRGGSFDWKTYRWIEK